MVALVGIGLCAGWGLLQVLPPRSVVSGTNPFRAVDGQPLVIAHAGGLALNPENTVEAFEHAAAMGCDALEMDVRLTQDGHLVTHHDASVDRTSDGSGLVIAQSLAELKRLNFGHHFTDPEGRQPFRGRPARLATVAELFERHPRVLMVIELKDRGDDGRRAAAALACLIERFQRADRVLVASFDDATLDAFRSSSRGTVPTSTPQGRTRTLVILNRLGLDWFGPVGDAAMQVPPARAGFQLDRPGLIRAAHRRNLAVHFWTINDPAEMRRLIALGADGLITDRPDLLQQVIREPRR